MKPKKVNLFDEADEPSTSQLKINTAYAERYDNWRQLEEMQKYKDKYGATLEDEEESSSESEPEWTPNDEKDFLQLLGALKTNNATIYEGDRSFFKSKDGNAASKPRSTDKKAKGQPLFLRDYERTIVTEKEGKFEEDDEQNDEAIEDEGYYETQDRIKQKLKKAISSTFEVESDDDLLTKRKKEGKEKEKEDEDYYKWLKNQSDKPIENAEQLQPLKEVWTAPDLDDNERFLRDFVLNRRYELDDKGGIPTYDEICELEEDEKEFDRQEEFETKYNLRYEEEPDQDFIRQYPRTVAESIRKKETKRKDQRETYRERKKMEKQEKMKEIAEMKQMKKMEINKKLAKLQKLAGDQIPLTVEDLEGDFDPAEYDRRMKELFNEDYYDKDDEMKADDLEKPVFSDLSSDEADEDESDDPDNVELGTLKANQSTDKEKVDESLYRGSQKKSGRRKKRNSRFAEVVSREKPQWDPKEKTFEEYFNEYYALDYEDILGDQRTKFKYRQVVPNKFGLEIDEILNADDRQLNSWASLKKATAYRTDAEELFDVRAYERKALDSKKKERIFSTDFGGKRSQKLGEEEDTTKVAKEIKVEVDQSPQIGGKLRNAQVKEEKSSVKPQTNGASVTKATKKGLNAEVKEEKASVKSPQANGSDASKATNKEKRHRTRKRKANKGGAPESVQDIDDQRLRAYGINPKKFKNRHKYTQDTKLR